MGRKKCWALGLNRRTAPELRSAYVPAIHTSSKTCTKEGGAMLLSCRLVWSGACLRGLPVHICDAWFGGMNMASQSNVQAASLLFGTGPTTSAKPSSLAWQGCPTWVALVSWCVDGAAGVGACMQRQARQSMSEIGTPEEISEERVVHCKRASGGGGVGHTHFRPTDRRIAGDLDSIGLHHRLIGCLS